MGGKKVQLCCLMAEKRGEVYPQGRHVLQSSAFYDFVRSTPRQHTRAKYFSYINRKNLIQ
jgi:hypothetical protein